VAGMAILAVSTNLLRRSWEGLLSELKEQQRQALAAAHTRLAQRQAVIERLSTVENEKTQLEHAKMHLQAQIDTLKHSQKTLHSRRQELESSKTVLELHVQERSEEVQRLQRQYELILNSAGEGICGLDLNGKATFVNPAAARMTGWKPDELIGKSEQDLF